jgi:predicted nucleic acid-binding protein
MSFLLDTNVVSELRRRKADPGVLSWFGSVPESRVFLSVLVIGEIRQGVARLARRDPVQADLHGQWLAQLLASYSDRVIPVTTEVAQRWGELNGRDPVPVVDGLLAATALVRDWTLVTRNDADVATTGVRVLNPWKI